MTVARVVAVDHRGVAGAADAQQRPRAVRMPRRAVGTRVTPSTGQSFSCASGSSLTARSNGASRTRVRGGTRTPASVGDRGGVLADQRGVEPAAGEDRVADPVALVGIEQVGAVPAPSRAANRSATASSTTSTLSLVHSTELSKALLSTSFFGGARRGRRSRRRGPARCPGPTPIAGLPEEYAARTTGDAAGGQDDVGARVGHQRVDQRDRRLLDPLDDAVGRAGRDRRLAPARGRRRSSTPWRTGAG